MNKVKSIINANYTFKDNKYVFKSNSNISKEDTIILMKNVLFKRGNVVWIDFGFNIGNEFGGMHPAVILNNFRNMIRWARISRMKKIRSNQYRLL